jgi:hypothetical protein
MPTAQEQFELLTQEIDRHLATEGFHRSGKHFLKLMPDKKVRWNIWPQRSKWTTTEQTKFTFEVYAEWKHRWARCEDWEPKTTWYGVIGNRIGYLMPQKKDTWWELAERTSVDFLSDQINGVMSSCALPFLKQFQTEHDIKNYLRAMPVNDYIHALAVLELDLMEKKSGSEIEEGVNRVRQLGKHGQIVVGGFIQIVSKVFKMFAKNEKARSEIEETFNQARPAEKSDYVEAAIQRVLKAYDYQS